MKMTEVFIINMDRNTEINSGSLGATEFLSIRKDISNSTAMIRFDNVQDVVRLMDELSVIEHKLRQIEHQGVAGETHRYSDKVRDSLSNANLEGKVGPYVDMKFETTPLHGTPKSKALVDEEKFKKFNDSIEGDIT